MKQQFSILFFVRKNRLGKDGTNAITLRLTVDGVPKEKQLSYRVAPDNWNNDKECVKSRNRSSIETNDYLNNLRADIQKRCYECIHKDIHFTPATILDEIFNNSNQKKLLISYFRQHADFCRSLIGKDYVYSTVNRYDNCIIKLTEFVKKQYRKDDVSFAEVNGEFVRYFEAFLKTEAGLAQNTMIRYMKAFKKVINIALSDQLMTKNPFAGIKFREVHSKREFLTLDELREIRNKEFGAERLNLTRDTFLFMCLTGLAHIDIVTLKLDDFLKDNDGNLWIIKDRVKLRSRTEVKSSIPLLPEAVEIIEKYKDHPLCQRKGTVIPVYCNQNMNSYLKEIADCCGINKKLTTHCARHTFATTVALGNGVSIKNVSHMLGHTTVRMTERYAKVLDPNISRDMQKVKLAL